MLENASALWELAKEEWPRRVPILGEDHRVKISHAVVNLFYNLITAGNRQSAARTKVVLNINHNQSTHLDPPIQASRTEVMIRAHKVNVIKAPIKR